MKTWSPNFISQSNLRLYLSHFNNETSLSRKKRTFFIFYCANANSQFKKYEETFHPTEN